MPLHKVLFLWGLEEDTNSESLVSGPRAAPFDLAVNGCRRPT